MSRRFWGDGPDQTCSDTEGWLISAEEALSSLGNEADRAQAQTYALLAIGSALRDIDNTLADLSAVLQTATGVEVRP